MRVDNFRPVYQLPVRSAGAWGTQPKEFGAATLTTSRILDRRYPGGIPAGCRANISQSRSDSFEPVLNDEEARQ
jgi:hypothetical protein